ncbi:hypothetical protein C1J03_22830 [Sulfitobacter sp. SK012]|nr:hypothetical protein C1J03_22830 [Sulfitobacter sp. SK012]
MNRCAKGWESAPPQTAVGFDKTDGIYGVVPPTVHSAGIIWTSKPAFAQSGAGNPTTWEEFNAHAPQLRSKANGLS